MLDNVAPSNAKSMPRYIAIDGLRAWLAWIVVGTHIVQQAFLDGGGSGWLSLDLGGQAVDAFIIISGFVITHLVIERPTRYLAYLVPRFMRLFPALFVCCIIGAVSYCASAKWAETIWFQSVHGKIFDDMNSNIVLNVISHITMVHGIIPLTIIPSSEYVFSPPAWSVSLEWQFYVIAPALLAMCRSRSGATLLVVLTAALALIYHTDLKSFWDRPSFLPGSIKYFLIGIASRLAGPTLAGSVKYVSAVGLGLGFTLFWMGSPAAAIWFIVYSFILRSDGEVGTFDKVYVRLLRSFLEARIVQILAERSYSTYLLHWSVIMLIGTIATRLNYQTGFGLCGIMCLTFPLTAILQEPIYRYVEVPGRKLGRMWEKRLVTGLDPVSRK